MIKSNEITKEKRFSAFKQVLSGTVSPKPAFCPLAKPIVPSFVVQFSNSHSQLCAGDIQLQVNACDFSKHPAWILCFQVSTQHVTSEGPSKEMGFVLCADSSSISVEMAWRKWW